MGKAFIKNCRSQTLIRKFRRRQIAVLQGIGGQVKAKDELAGKVTLINLLKGTVKVCS